MTRTSPCPTTLVPAICSTAKTFVWAAAGQDWRDGISSIFANGGEIAKYDGGKWVDTLDNPNTLKGMEPLQNLYRNASHAPSDMKDAPKRVRMILQVSLLLAWAMPVAAAMTIWSWIFDWRRGIVNWARGTPG